MEFIKILNMEEYNPRKDRKKHSWFRVDNTIVFSKKLHGLTDGQKWLWVGLVALASSEQRDWTEYDIQYWIDYIGGTDESIRSAIEHFKNKKMIEILSAEPSGNHPVTNRLPTGDNPESSENQSVSSGVPTDGRTDGRYVTDGQTEETPSAVQADAVGKVIPELQDDFLNPILCHVKPDIQREWLQAFPDKGWVKKTLRKCFMKRKARNLKFIPEQVASVATSWLHSEDNPPVVKTALPPPPEPPPDPRGRKQVEELLSENQLKELRKFRGGVSHAG